MNAETKLSSPLAKLREPFPPHQISKLPKPYKKDSPKGKCNECGGYHGLPAVHLDYVGHAALTDRLLDVDPEWSWEPMGRTPEGLPVVNGGLWIKLTVCGVSRYGFGAADGKSGGDAIKEMIGDALRNAAMRFGAALDLWHKGDLHVEEDEAQPVAKKANGRDSPFPQGPAKNKTELKELGRTLWREVEGCGDPDELEALISSHGPLTKQIADALPDWWRGGQRDGEPYEGLGSVITRKQLELSNANPDWKSNPIIGG